MSLKKAANVRKFDALTDSQQDYFFVLAHKLIYRVETEIGPTNFYGNKESVFNIIMWVPFLLALVDVVCPIIRIRASFRSKSRRVESLFLVSFLSVITGMFLLYL
jgi:hypothetical protein